jgi:tRNA A37 threonylcarbamoyladenosine biosynthesis protein TsaE
VHASVRGLSEAELVRFGEALGAALRPGHVVLLRGPMGAGKTTLTRAIAHGLRVHRPDRVRSPTFNICLVHDGPIPLHHIDLFRLAADDDASIASPPCRAEGPSPAFGALGLESLFDETERAVVVVEWAELMQVEVDALTIALQPAGPDRRDVEVSARGEAHAGLVGILNAVPQIPA